MTKVFPQLSSPFSIGKLTIKNRFAVAPMDPGFDVAPDGSFTQMGIDYYVRRAVGGFGLIYTGGMGIDTDFERFAPSILDNPAAFIRTRGFDRLAPAARSALAVAVVALGCHAFASLNVLTKLTMGMSFPDGMTPLPMLVGKHVLLAGQFVLLGMVVTQKGKGGERK